MFNDHLSFCVQSHAYSRHRKAVEGLRTPTTTDEMHLQESPSLTFEEIDDLLYFTRANDTEELGQTILELAQKYNCSAKDVLRAAVDPDSKNTVLHFCSANGFTDLLKSFLTQLGGPFDASVSVANNDQVDAIVNKRNSEGNTSLHWAAYNGHLEAVKLLLAAGADMWIKNSAGHLAMFEAERAYKSDVVQFLLDAGGSMVEQVGLEREQQASAEDMAEIQNGDPGPSNTGERQNGMADVNWGEPRPSD